MPFAAVTMFNRSVDVALLKKVRKNSHLRTG